MSLDSEVIARIDPEEFFDFQDNRPTIRLTAGQARRIEWPENTLIAAPAPSAERDLVLLSGTEPSLRWRTFTDLLADAMERLGVEIVVTLGALIADVAHTRPVPITGLASDPELVEQLGLSRSKYEGPTGIVGVLHDACRRRDLHLGEPVGGRPPLRRRRPQPEGRPGAAPPPRGAHRRRRRGVRARGGLGARSTVRSTAPWPPTPRSRSSCSGSRPSRAEAVELEQDVPSGESIAQRLPALPAPTHRRRLINPAECSASRPVRPGSDESRASQASLAGQISR